MPIAPPTVEDHVRNLRFRDNRVLFNNSAKWLDEHREEGLPLMGELLAEGGPPAVGIARVMGAFDDVRCVVPLEAAMASADDALAFEAARALAQTANPAAREALRRGAASPEVAVAKNALRGMELRKDPDLCDDARVHLQSAEPLATYAQRALDAMDC